MAVSVGFILRLIDSFFESVGLLLEALTFGAVVLALLLLARSKRRRGSVNTSLNDNFFGRVSKDIRGCKAESI
jgi:hypothetical protein